MVYLIYLLLCLALLPEVWTTNVGQVVVFMTNQARKCICKASVSGPIWILEPIVATVSQKILLFMFSLLFLFHCILIFYRFFLS